MKIILTLISFCSIIFFVTTAGAQSRILSQQQIERIKIFKAVIADIDAKTLQKTISEIERAKDPEIVLQIQETIVKVYQDILADQKISDLPTKKWLYNAVSLNMANIQFGGVSYEPVHRMIMERLTIALPASVTSNPYFRVSVD